MTNKLDLLFFSIIRCGLQKAYIFVFYCLQKIYWFALHPKKIFYYFFMELSGFRAIWYKFFPPSAAEKEKPNYRPPATIGIWFFSLYFALLGFAIARYEGQLDRAEFKFNTLTTEIAAGMIFDSDIVKEVGQTLIPYEPKVDFCWEGLLSPWSYFCKPIIQSLLSNDAFYKRFVIRNKEKLIIGYKPIASADEFVLMMTELWKTKLCNANLSNIDLSNVDLSNAELSNADFSNTNLSNAKLMNANLSNANFDGAKLIDANLINTNLTNAESFSGNFYKANFLSADLSDASFIDANLTDANLTEAILSNTDIGGANLSNACLEYVKFSKNPEQQFSQVKTLYGIKGLPPNLERLLKKNKPELFIQPKE